MPEKKNQLHDFGPFRVDPEERLLTRDGVPIPLAPKTLDLLLFFVRNRGRVLAKEDLLGQVWPGVFVEESNLTKNVFLLRKCLGNRQDGRPYIETFPKRGYRFDTGQAAPASPPVEGDQAEPVPDVPSFPPERRRIAASYVWIAAGVALIAATAGMIGWEKQSQTVRSLAVLPFRITDTPEAAYLSNGLAEELSIRLARLSSLRVISPQVAARFKDSADPTTAGRKLGVEGVLIGTLRAEGERLRARIQLIRTQDGAVIWADSALDEPLRNLVEAERDLAESVVSGLRVRLTPQERASVQRIDTRSAQAYECVLRGKARYAVAFNNIDREERDVAAGLFARAVQLDPGYADGHAWMAMTDLLYPKSRADVDDATRHAQTALSIDPDQIVARRALVSIFYEAGRSQEGLPHARRLLVTAPRDPMALAVAGRAYFRAGLAEKGIALLEEAIQADPQDSATRYDLGFDYLYTGQNLKAFDILAPLAEAQRVRWILAFHYADFGNCEKSKQLAHTLADETGMESYFLGIVLARCGEPGGARSLWSQDAARWEHRGGAADGIGLALEYATKRPFSRRGMPSPMSRSSRALLPTDGNRRSGS